MKKMVKLVSVILALVMCVGVFASCSKKDDNVLTMATNAEFPPFEYLENGEMVGAEIDMAYAIAEKLGMELEISNIDFDAALAGPATGKYDVAISGITANDERRKNMNFSDPYYVASQAIIVMENSEIKVAADLKGKTISCQEGTTGEQFILDNKYDIQSYKTGADAIAALTAGKVDAVVIDDAVARALSAENQGTKVLEEPLTKEEYAIALKLGNDELTEKINKALAELKAEGKLVEIFSKYNLPMDGEVVVAEDAEATSDAVTSAAEAE
ncbi:MAG: basic amino acid ABC transporter substrate-binding protein [Ruminococcaceae bacterium]|nr:basic amino acid ABC transporter substrate-binding protein [Oscillospiraceae bacterium]